MIDLDERSSATALRMIRNLTIALLLSALAAGRTAAQPQTPYTAPSPTIDVSIEVTVEGGGKPVIIGKTNLPDGFQAIASLQEGKMTLGQAKIEVRSGHFTAGPFSMQGTAYPRGTYTVVIDSPLTELQPPSVQAAVGQNGAFLRGSWVKLDLGQRLIAFRTPIEIH